MVSEGGGVGFHSNANLTHTQRYTYFTYAYVYMYVYIYRSRSCRHIVHTYNTYRKSFKCHSNNNNNNEMCELEFPPKIGHKIYHTQLFPSPLPMPYLPFSLPLLTHSFYRTDNVLNLSSVIFDGKNYK